VATVYKFTTSLPVSDTLPRNRITNTIHLEHVTGGINDDALESMCADLVAVYRDKYPGSVGEITTKAYDTDAKPNYPRAVVTEHAGNPWGCNTNHELALVLSFAGPNRGDKSGRGRIFTMPQLLGGPQSPTIGERPTGPIMDWALSFYSTPNSSFPDLGGVDWKFGIWSPTYKRFTQAQQAWVNDDWDVMRSRGLRESTRRTATREG
jgi:hypothetical protein